ncbi:MULTISPECIES: alpha/beta hydrolase [unclassified Streptomyces]|uniref:alpha/beta hydrolase n=1 Tax=unclassified Streptomyces TaxID=2593676 RepID=UPI001BE591C2|nr:MULTISPECIES: alpha/beta hydrolase [unclassified Streptomyces]MBT2405353.1 alpha/beta fold hydrolase [Streptomyces sp. ISL-21]MBT2454320.1 alpha/beta fold hydrolase [Streptomyces sp. ISL-86]MBT2611488.1 alpha/beta fold hydrolase [Streptomyces sp. ISL-87]
MIRPSIRPFKKRAAVLLSLSIATVAATLASPVTAAPAAPAAPKAAALTWTGCATTRYPTLQCASLKVPLDHDRPTGRQITLALTRVPHTAAKSQGPLLVNPGGPGGSGRGLAGYIASALPKDVAAQYDVIGFDPRGVGKSEPALDCGAGHFTPVRPDSVPRDENTEQANLERVRSFAESCQTKHADVLPYIGTVSAARDIEVLRTALGAEKVSYFGYSYGTYLGAVYAKLHPARVHRLVLDSVVDPSGVWYEDNLAQDQAFDARHKAFLAWVAQYDATYRLGTDPAEVEERWYAMRDAVRETPAGGKVGPAELEDTFLPGGYYNGYWPNLAEAFSAYAVTEDPKPLVAAYERFGAVEPSAGNSYSVYSAVQCRDSAWPKDWNQWRADMWRTHAKAPFMTWNNAWYNAPCAFWRTEPLQAPDVTNTGLPQALLLQATEDAATPFEGALSMREKLAGSALVVEEGGGNHGISLSGNKCLDEKVSAYLKTGRATDATCPAQPAPKPAPLTRAVPPSAGGAALHGLLGFRG